MTKEEYMDKLRSALAGYSESVSDEIISDYEEHFEEGRKAGKTDDEIISNLGDIDEMTQNLEDVKCGKEEKSDRKASSSASVSFSSLSVIIDTQDTDIEMEPSDDASVHVSFEEDRKGEHEYSFTENDGTLHLSVAGAPEKRSIFSNVKAFRNLGFNLTAGRSRLRVTVPEKTEEVKIESKSGDVSASSVKSREISISSYCGDVECELMKCDSISLRSMSGDISMSSSECREAGLFFTSGDVELKKSRLEKAEMKSTSGDIFSSGDRERIDAKIVSGDVDCTLTSVFRKGTLISASGSISVTSDGASFTAKAGTLSEKVRFMGLSARDGNTFRIGDGKGSLVLESMSGNISLNK